MIYFVTLNPALDVSGFVDELKPDEKSYVFGELHTAGGNGINAGIIAHRLGARVKLLGLLGGANGQEIRKLLLNEKIPQDFTEIQGHTRMNFSISNRSNHHQTRLSFPGPRILKKEFHELTQVLLKCHKRDKVVIGGSFPEGVSSKDLAQVIRRLKKRGAQVFLDVPGKELKKLVSSRPTFIKPNLVEFQQLVGKEVQSAKAVIKASQKLRKLVPYICVSSVEGGALFLTPHGDFFGATPPLKIRSTVGAGDSMVGAMLSLWENDGPSDSEDLLRIGLAAAGATLSQRGMKLGERKHILRLIGRVPIKHLS